MAAQTNLLKAIQYSLIIFSVILVGIIFWLFHRFERRQELSMQLLLKTNEDLQEADLAIKSLQGIIPICSYCKKIRDEKGLWNQLELYIQEHSEATFSHGACPSCYDKQIKELRKHT